MTHAVVNQLRDRAVALGLDALRVARADAPWPVMAGAPPADEALRRFVALDRHGSMNWMETTIDRRAHPTALWPEAKSAVVVGLNYGPAHDPRAGLAHPRQAVVSVYAQGGDYHDVLKRKLKQLAGLLAEQTGASVKVFVDTAPLMEKPLAEQAGLGWRGKHTNLVSRSHGSWLFLGVILTDAVLPADEPERDHCGACRRCLAACPTDAFPAPYELDARRCLAYLTIEHKGPIPREFRAAMGNRVFGCDDCLAVCPWNKFAQTAREAALHPRPQTVAPDLLDLAGLDDAAFRTVFAGSPLKRTGRDRIVRNAALALGNSGNAAALPRVRSLLDDAADVVRGAAVWALQRLAPGEFAREAVRRCSGERVGHVREEWTAGLRLAPPSR